MDEHVFQDDGWEVIKDAKFHVRVNRPHVEAILTAKRLMANVALIKEIASYAQDVRVVK